MHQIPCQNNYNLLFSAALSSNKPMLENNEKKYKSGWIYATLKSLIIVVYKWKILKLMFWVSAVWEKQNSNSWKLKEMG